MAEYSDRDKAVIRKLYADTSISDKALDYRIAEELGRSSDAVAIKRRRMGLKIDRRGGDVEEIEADPSIEEDLLDYVLVGDTYVFQVEGGVFPVPRETWELICADYSEMGGDLTQKEIALEYGIPHPILKRILRKAGQFKASLPLSREAIAEEPEDVLVTRSLAAKERRVARKLQRAEINQMRRDYLRLREEREQQTWLIEAARELLAESGQEPDRVEKLYSYDGDNLWAAHAPTTDEHIGSLVWSKESFGENYDTDIACHRLMAHADNVASWILSQPGRCETLYRSLVGDLWDSILGETEHGTSLDQDTRPAKVFAAGIRALKYSINVLRQVSDRVVITGSRGNHDGKFEFWVTLFHLAEAFADADDVEVDPTPSRFAGFRVGSTLHVLDHDYGGGSISWKRKAQAESVARHVAGDDWSKVRDVITYMGHKHELEVGSNSHLRLIRLPALCEPDAHATDYRYDNDGLKAIAYRLDESGRIRSPYWIYRRDLE